MNIALFEKLDHAVFKSCMARNCPLPLTDDAKDEITSRVKKVLGICDSWQPGITILQKSTQHFDDVTVEHWRFRSWDGIEATPRCGSRPISPARSRQYCSITATPWKRDGSATVINPWQDF